MTVLVVGSVALDTVSNQYGRIDEGLGGSATYFSLAAISFCPVNLVAVVGTDFPRNFQDLLVNRGIDIRGLKSTPGQTFRWSGEYTPDLNRAITLETRLNVFEQFRPVIPQEYRSVESLFLANIDPVLQLDVLSKVDNPRLVACDTMNFWIERQHAQVMEVLRKVTILFINEEEARMLSGVKSLVESARFILANGPSTVVIKRGVGGVAVFQGDKVFTAPVYCTAKVIDTTGAGDSFAGGFMGYLTRRGDYSWENITRAAICGTIIASFNIESFSIHRLNLLRREEVEHRWREYAAMTRFSDEPGPFDGVHS